MTASTTAHVFHIRYLDALDDVVQQLATNRNANSMTYIETIWGKGSGDYHWVSTDVSGQRDDCLLNLAVRHSLTDYVRAKFEASTPSPDRASALLKAALTPRKPFFARTTSSGPADEAKVSQEMVRLLLEYGADKRLPLLATQSKPRAINPPPIMFQNMEGKQPRLTRVLQKMNLGMFKPSLR